MAVVGDPPPRSFLPLLLLLLFSLSLSLLHLTGVTSDPPRGPLTGSSDRSSDRGGLLNAGSPGILCWSYPSSPPCSNGDTAASLPSRASPGSHGMRVTGQGCSLCRVGRFCFFSISTSPPVRWNVTGTVPLEWDLMIVLRGPSLVYADVSLDRGSSWLSSSSGRTTGKKGGPIEGDRLKFVASYRSWDAGEYRVHVTSRRGNLVLPGVDPTPYLSSRDIFTVASWNLTILELDQVSFGCGIPPSLRETSLRPGTGQDHTPSELPYADSLTRGVLYAGQGGSSPLGTPSSERDPEGNTRGPGADSSSAPDSAAQTNLESFAGVLNPCLEGLKARWVKGHGKVVYHWAQHPCAGNSGLPEMLDSLPAAGVREIAFIGDSHMRLLLLHTASLLNTSLDPLWRDAHFNLNVTIHLSPHPGHRRSAQGILLTFYWVDGVYSKGEYGCGLGGDGWFPNITTSPDIAIINSGAWSSVACTQALLAYSSHLDRFLQLVGKQLKEKGTKLTTFVRHPPRPSALFNATSSLLTAQSDVARIVAGHHGMTFLDSWRVLGPMFHATCGPRNHHYSCARITKYGLGLDITNDVGEALVMDVFRYLSDAMTDLTTIHQ